MNCNIIIKINGVYSVVWLFIFIDYCNTSQILVLRAADVRNIRLKENTSHKLKSNQI